MNDANPLLLSLHRHCRANRQLHCAVLPVAGCVNAGGGGHRKGRKSGVEGERGNELVVDTIEPVKIDKIESDAIRRGSRRVLRLEGDGCPASKSEWCAATVHS